MIFIGHVDSGKTEVIKALLQAGEPVASTASSSRANFNHSFPCPRSSSTKSNHNFPADQKNATSTPIARNPQDGSLLGATTPAGASAGHPTSGSLFGVTTPAGVTAKPSYLDQTRGWGPGKAMSSPSLAGPNHRSAAPLRAAPCAAASAAVFSTRSGTIGGSSANNGRNGTIPPNGNIVPPSTNTVALSRVGSTTLQSSGASFVTPTHNRRWENVHSGSVNSIRGTVFGSGGTGVTVGCDSTRSDRELGHRTGSSGHSNRIGFASSSSAADSKDEVAMAIRTWTPTVKLRKRLPQGFGEGTASGSGGGWGAGGGSGEAEITLKLWDFGGTEEFHSVHGLFFSGLVEFCFGVALSCRWSRLKGNRRASTMLLVRRAVRLTVAYKSNAAQSVKIAERSAFCVSTRPAFREEAIEYSALVRFPKLGMLSMVHVHLRDPPLHWV